MRWRPLRTAFLFVSPDLDLAARIRTIPDHPKPGILFRDVTTLLRDSAAFAAAVDGLAAPFASQSVAAVAAIEARGFILGGAVACRLGAGFVPLRKPGKLPHAVASVEYALEYGQDRLEMHLDAVAVGERVLLVDDLIATGGTAAAAVQLLRGIGAEVVAACFIIDLPDLGGADRLRGLGLEVRTLIGFEGH